VTVKEIKESGIIEYYVLGLLSEKEVNQVRGYLEKYPELQKDYEEIQLAMQLYAKANGEPPRDGLSNDITEFIKNNGEETVKENSSTSEEEPKQGSNIFKNFAILFGFATLFGLYLSKHNNYKELQKSNSILQEECDSTINAQQSIIVKYESLNNSENKSLSVTPTENYTNTQLVFHNNKSAKKNFIQILNLPEINNDQAFQLWSLKPDTDPIPLTVFKNDGNFIIPVDFEEGTQTYAITIENEAGAEVPTLTRLIGTVGV